MIRSQETGNSGEKDRSLGAGNISMDWSGLQALPPEKKRVGDKD